MSALWQVRTLGVSRKLAQNAMRCMGSAKRERSMPRYHSKKRAGEEADSYPDFSTILRQLYRRSHPDLLRHSHPELARTNDDSMQLLNSILSAIKKPNQYPPATKEDITFHVKSQDSGEYELHILSIRTSGGDCKKQLTTAFETFFASSKLAESGKFVWNKEYFPLLGIFDKVEKTEESEAK